MSSTTVLGATLLENATRFAVRAPDAARVTVCLFEGEQETRHAMARGEDGVWSLTIAGVGEGARYVFRADGDYRPDEGLWFDPDKLLVDPYAVEIDRPYRYDPLLAARRGEGADTASLVPKSVVRRLEPLEVLPPRFKPGGLIYEVNVRGFTKLHLGVPKGKRGTLAALAEPAVLDHLVRLGVDAVELMPVTAWIDERHLPSLGLTNAWGYNPVTFKALDPRLAPGGIVELRDTVAALRAAGIGTILDLVFNHTGESDVFGPTLSLRGLDERSYYRHSHGGVLVNDTGTGNTVACDYPAMVDMVLAALRHFVSYAGVDGFRFDLAPVLGRRAEGFSPDAPLLNAILDDQMLADRILIAEPWDIGPGGYQLGNFPPRFLEWNDRYRDDMRRFWRGDPGMLGALATRLAGSSDIFARSGEAVTRSVNFLAAHDGMTLADVTSFTQKRNEANGEGNRDGHNENLSWNCGAEGPDATPEIAERRKADIKAMLGTLFGSRGTIMLTTGDEFGRSQGGNNNAYAQDNAITWIDWDEADAELLAHAQALSKARKAMLGGGADRLVGEGDVAWLTPQGELIGVIDWEEPENRVLALLHQSEPRSAVLVNGADRAVLFRLPARDNYRWSAIGGTARGDQIECAPRSTVLAMEAKSEGA